jgi:hypothetical protein
MESHQNTQTIEATTLVSAPDGGFDYGEINQEMAVAIRRQAGKIKLQNGVHNDNGTGFGLLHIEANHGKQIRALGFPDVPSFVYEIASNIHQVWQSKGIQLLVNANRKPRVVMFVQLEAMSGEDFYRVNTAFPVRQSDYELRHGMKKLWDGSEPQSIAAGQRSLYAADKPETSSSQVSTNAQGQSNCDFKGN